jgi:hypothetical protein
MWVLLKALIGAELRRLWRRMLGRPEPPGPFAGFRTRTRPGDEPMVDPASRESDSSL